MTLAYEITLTIVAIVGVFASIYVFLRTRIAKETLNLMETNKKAQDDRIRILEESDQHKANQISTLSGQVDVLKTLPLKQIAESMGSLSKSHELLSTYMTNHDKQVADGVQKIIDHIDLRLAK